MVFNMLIKTVQIKLKSDPNVPNYNSDIWILGFVFSRTELLFWIDFGLLNRNQIVQKN